MSKSYSGLKEVINALSASQVDVLQKYLWEMDDTEFSQIPTLLFSPDAKKIIETYGATIMVSRKNPRRGDNEKEYIEHTIYCIFPAFFKIII